ncbi:MAG: purine-nucleoside phosphorylase [Spirochaetia bacterium]|nr:purine-nucleoside phosphorylase [Spirochaetia bacterium]
MATPHNRANPGDIAETILLPGDPLRAKFIAEHYLEDAVLFNDVRNMFGYTGYWNGVRVSTMGTGMGIPSISIYTEELCRFYGVKKLIRVGSCGAMQPDIKLYDIILAMSACTDSSINNYRFDGGSYAPTASFDLLYRAYEHAGSLGITPHVGTVTSSDTFYTIDGEDISWQQWAAYGSLAVEMESAGLYTTAARHGVQALSILTVSDSLVHGQEVSSEEREKAFTTMMEIALQLA